VRQTFDARTDHGGLASKPTLLPFEHSVTPTESPNSASRAAAWVSARTVNTLSAFMAAIAVEQPLVLEAGHRSSDETLANAHVGVYSD